MPPSTSSFTSCELGQQSVYQPPVLITSRLPSASSSTSVGWKSVLSLTTKSESSDVKVAPVVVSTCRLIFRKLNWHEKTLSRYSGPNWSVSSRCKPHDADGP